MDHLNKWLGLIANFGVVIGIGFLAYETSLNTDALRATTAAQQTATYTGITNEAAASPSLVDALISVNAGAPDPTSYFQAFYHASSVFKSTEFSYMQWKAGNMDEELWLGTLSGHRIYVTSPFMLVGWASGIRMAVAPSFREFMDDMIREICAEQTCPEGGRPEDW